MMARGLRQGGILVALFLAIAVFGLTTILRQARQPANVPLDAIHRYTERYEGQRVQVSGVVRVFEDSKGRYYVLEDAQKNRILLRTDLRQISRRVGFPITAVGVVGFADNEGIFLDVESLR